MVSPETVFSFQFSVFSFQFLPLFAIFVSRFSFIAGALLGNLCHAAKTED
jgi:hypothetical protein